MKLTKSQLKKIIKEEFDTLKEQGPFQDTVSVVRGIRDTIVGYIESEGFFEPGGIPHPVISVIENASLRVVRAIEGGGHKDDIQAIGEKNEIN
jgi:hypothetical protein